MKLIKIVRTGGLRNNETFQESFEYKETSKFFVIQRPKEHSNKNLIKELIMKPNTEIGMGASHLIAVIWCFDYQETEAKEILEEAIKKAIEKERVYLEKQISNLEALKERVNTKINIVY